MVGLTLTVPALLGIVAILVLTPLSAALGDTLVGDRPIAPPFLGMPSESELGAPAEWTTEVAFPALTFDDPTFMIPGPTGDRIYVTEREGRVLSFEPTPHVQSAVVVLDLRENTQGDSDSGLLSLAFHPDFAVPGSDGEGALFVAYSWRAEPPEEDPKESLPLHFRVSRFQIQPGRMFADRESEQVLIDQLDQNLWHQGGAMFFHPDDGFLYVSIGDEGGGRCIFWNCQRIDWR